MREVFRPGVSVGACTTLIDKSRELGGNDRLLDKHMRAGTIGFPKPVAQFGRTMIFVDKELDAFYQSVMWRQADRSIAELTGEGV